MTKKRIIILGAGVMQSPSLRIAREMALSTVVCDGNANAEFLGLADRFEHIDLKDKERILELASALAKEPEGLAGIMTAGTDFSATVAFVAERLGLPGIPYETALDASDKSRMRGRFAACAVPSPAFVVMTAPPGKDAALPFGYPVVVKPVDNMGARGCRRADNAEALRDAVKDAVAFSRGGRAIVEEYMEGPEYSVDALVYHGEVTICGLADRHIFYPPYFIEMGHTMSAVLSPKDEKNLLDVFKAGIKALGITDGAAKGDIKLTGKGAMIGEIAARLSGGYMSGWTYPYASGVEPARGALQIAIGEKPSGLAPLKNHTSAERAFISIPGTVRSVYGVREARGKPFVKDVFLRINPGDAVNFPVNNVSKCGNVISAAPDYQDAVNAANSAAREILIDLEYPNAATEEFLASKSGFPPDAYFAGGGVDYAGRTREESLEAARRITGIKLSLPECDANALRALDRGGYQGLVYELRRRGFAK